MSEIISFLSGGVPGGILLLFIALLIINLSLQFFVSSKLMDVKLKRRRQLTYSAIAILIYVVLWAQFRPPLPRERVIVLPTVNQNGKIQMRASSFRLAEYLRRYALNNLTSRYIMHRWQWLLEAMDKDSLQNPAAWQSLARRMHTLLLVESKISDGKLHYRFYNRADESASAWFVAEDTLSYRDFVQNIDDKFEVFTGFKKVSIPPSRIIDAEIFFHLHNFDKVMAVLNGLEMPHADILRAAVYIRRGLKIRIDREKAKYVKIHIPEFDRAKQLLQKLIKSRQDNAYVAYLLGRIAIQEEKFNMAEVFLKKALIDDPTNARVYYALSFLLPVRLEDLGYKKRTEVLEKAVYYDPAYRDAVYELANEYYLSGTGTQTGHGTTSAIKTIRKYLEIRKGDPQIVALLGILYIKTERLEEAQAIFSELLQRFPKDSNLNYDMGIVFFHKMKYDEAISYFQKAIAIDDNPDAYLYLGYIYRELGDKDKALQYFRDRVRRRMGDDDVYAKEAMRAIRKLLNPEPTTGKNNAQ